MRGTDAGLLSCRRPGRTVLAMRRYHRARHRRALNEATELLAAADGVLIGAGAGMSAESGLRPYRGPTGLWHSRQTDAGGLTARERASAAALHADPDGTLAHFAALRAQMANAVPHAGYRALHELAASKPAGAFVYTSNIDRLFTAAGFAEERLYECHGSLAHSQCLARCGQPPWPAPHPDPRQPGDHRPRCPGCGAGARPNVLLFDDFDFDGRLRQAQWQDWGRWLRDRRTARLVVVEIGAGTAIPAIRGRSEALAASRGLPLIRINLHEARPHHRLAGVPPVVALPLAAAPALSRICRGR